MISTKVEFLVVWIYTKTVLCWNKIEIFFCFGNYCAVVYCLKETDITQVYNFQVCLRLYKRYHEAYCDTKQKIEDAEDETNLEASEMFVFGKFRTFKTRLSKVSRRLEYNNFSSPIYSSVKLTLWKISVILVYISARLYKIGF